MRCDHCARSRCVYPACQLEERQSRRDPSKVLNVIRWEQRFDTWRYVFRTRRDSMLGLERPPPLMRVVK